MSVEKHRAMVLFGSAPALASMNIELPPYEQRLAVYRVLESAANAGAGFNITLGSDQAKVIARIMVEHERMLGEVVELRAFLEAAKKRLLGRRRK